MRAGLAAVSTDRLSRAVILTAGLLCGALVLFVGLPLARSNPYPTPRDGGWAAESAAPYRLASLASLMPPPGEPQEPTPIEAQAAIEWEALTASLVEMPALRATRIPDPVWDEPDFAAREPAASKDAKDAAKKDSSDPVTVGSLPPAKETPAKRPTNPMDEVDAYLWEVYGRVPTKRDGSGDFTWKDPAAAKRFGVSMPAYVIGGMDRDFREQLYHAGKAMDAAGIRWSILSAFRDDYRQALASGFKARVGNSLHGGSRATGGYGHGRAVDVTNADGDHEIVWRWIDRNGARYGLFRPLPGPDPAHVQPRANWRAIAANLRASRTKIADASADRKPARAEKEKKTKVARSSR